MLQHRRCELCFYKYLHLLLHGLGSGPRWYCERSRNAVRASPVLVRRMRSSSFTSLASQSHHRHHHQNVGLHLSVHRRGLKAPDSLQVQHQLRRRPDATLHGQLRRAARKRDPAYFHWKEWADMQSTCLHYCIRYRLSLLRMPAGTPAKPSWLRQGADTPGQPIYYVCRTSRSARAVRKLDAPLRCGRHVCVTMFRAL